MSRIKMIDFVCKAWYDANKITDKMVYNSFRATDIANNLNHSEDELFTSWKKMENEKAIIDNDLENDYSIDNEEINDEDEI